MAVNYTTALRSARMIVTRDACASGTLHLLDASDNVLSAHLLTETGGSVAEGVWTLEFTDPTVGAVASGTATGARIRDAGGNDVVTGLTVGLADADVVMQATSINAGQDITMTAATLADG